MVELYTIQQRGFHNIYDENGEIVGFQFCFVPGYYKGYWFTQVRFGDVVVDGETYSRDDIIYEYDGIEYTREEMFDLNKYWQFRTYLVYKIKKPGGLSIGYHDIHLDFGWVLNYNGGLEKELDGSGLGNITDSFGTGHDRRILLCR